MTQPTKSRITVYVRQADNNRLDRLMETYGLGASAAMRAGLALLERKLSLERKEKTMSEFVSYMETEDRVAQVNHLKEIAGNIRAGGVGDGTPEEQVAYYTKHHILPTWFDPHDYHLLTEFVAD